MGEGPMRVLPFAKECIGCFLRRSKWGAAPMRLAMSLVYALARWNALRDRVRRGVCTVVKIATKVMPVDFLTKWCAKAKVEESIEYLTNARNAVVAA